MKKFTFDKKSIALFTVAGVFFSGVALVAAKDIPGITRPYDPPAYYSETAVSYRDSPSPFALMDLARNGFAVRDVTLNKKSIVTDVKTYTEMVNQTISVANKAANLNPVAGDVMAENIGKITEETEKLSKKIETTILDDTDKIFRSAKNFSDPTRQFEDLSQLKFVEHVYKTAVQNAKDTSFTQRGEALLMALKRSGDAEGEVAALQASAEVKAIQDNEINRKNALLAQYAIVQTTCERVKNDRDLKAWKDTRDGMAFSVIDPYHATESEKKAYQRPEGQGFIDF